MPFIRRRLGLGIFAAAVVVSAAVVVPTVALASSGGEHTESVPACSNSNTYVWFALAPSGAAGTIYYPIEFTNIGTSSCYLYGYPGVQAINSADNPVGPAASRLTLSHGDVVLKPNQTAYALLGIVEKGVISGCTATQADGLQVYPPNETQKQFISDFTFSACKNKVYLHVYPVKSGIGVP